MCAYGQHCGPNRTARGAMTCASPEAGNWGRVVTLRRHQVGLELRVRVGQELGRIALRTRLGHEHQSAKLL